MKRHHNHGLRKICGCPRRLWPKCDHGWHLNFKHAGTHYRFSLDRHAGRHLTSKAEALAEADVLRSGSGRELWTVNASSADVDLGPPRASVFRPLHEGWRGREAVARSVRAYRNLSTTSRYLATTRRGIHQVFGQYEQRRAEKTGKSCKFVARKEGSTVSLKAPSTIDGDPNSLQ